MQTIEILCGDHDDPDVREVRHAVEVLPGLFAHSMRAINGEMKHTNLWDFTHGRSGYRIPMLEAYKKSQVVAIVERLEGTDFTQPMDELVTDGFKSKVFEVAEGLGWLEPFNRDRKENINA